MTRPSMELSDIGQRIVADGRKNDHYTADPIFLVQERKRVYGIDTQYDPLIEWQYGDECNALDEAQSAIADKFFREYDEDPWCIADGVAYGEGHSASGLEESNDYVSDLKRVGYAEYWEFVQPFFTKEAAEYFIATNGHNYSMGLRVYVDSGYRNWEWQAIREHLKTVASSVKPDPVMIPIEDA